MNIAIIGASGFVGQNLIKDLLKNTNHNIVAISPNPENINIERKYQDRVTKIQASVLDYIAMKKAINNIDIAYYLVHMMSNNKNNFYEKENSSAEITGQILQSKNVKRVIYMSGLGNDKEKLSKHLSSRHNTGNVFRKYVKEVIELRASMIIGEGSISFEIVRNLIEKSPIITLPRWSITKTQPIGISDVLEYLRDSLHIQIDNHEIIEIGGKEIMSYKDFVKRYAKYKNKKRVIIRISFLSEKMAGLFLNIFTPKEQTRVGRCMLSSFKNEMIVTNDKASILFPHINPKKIEESFI